MEEKAGLESHGVCFFVLIPWNGVILTRNSDGQLKTFLQRFLFFPPFSFFFKKFGLTDFKCFIVMSFFWKRYMIGKF